MTPDERDRRLADATFCDADRRSALAIHQFTHVSRGVHSGDMGNTSSFLLTAHSG